MKRHGFTIIELCVVIAIIGVLLVLILGSLRWARVKAQAAACASQLVQMHQASVIYANDNDGWILRDGWRDPVSGNVANKPWFTMIDRRTADASPLEAVHLLAKNNLLKCPSHPLPTRPSSYVVNAFARLWTDVFNGEWEIAGATKLSSVRKSSSVIFIVDRTDRSGRWPDLDGHVSDEQLGRWYDQLDVWNIEQLPEGVIAPRVARDRHGNDRINALYFDGSVREVKPTALTPHDFYDGITHRRDRLIMKDGRYLPPGRTSFTSAPAHR